jgi:hypothetical protein
VLGALQARFTCTVSPVAPTAIATVGLVEELLAIVSVPFAAPATVGLNSTLRVAVCAGFRVRGKVAPETEKPVPLIPAEVTVTGAVPVEDRVTVCVAGEFCITLPKAMLVALMLSVGTPVFSCRAKVSATLLALAVNVAVCVVLNVETVAIKLAVVDPATTVTLAGTVTAELLLARLTA